MSKRFFKLFDNVKGEYAGRYVGRTPEEAAKNAAEYYLDKYNLVTCEITIKESTRSSNRDIFKYHASKMLLDNPVTRKINTIYGQRIVEINYEIILEPINMNALTESYNWM